MLFSNAFEKYRKDETRVQKWVKIFTQVVQKPDQKVFLDCGCGVGRFTIPLSGLFMTAYGVDNDGSMIDIASQKDSGVRWIQSDVSEIPLENNSVDVVLASMLIEHLDSLDPFLKEMSRLVNEKGMLLIRTMLPEDIDKTTWYSFSQKIYQMELSRTYTLDRLSKCFGAYNFKLSCEKSNINVTESFQNSNLVDRLKAKSYEILHQVEESDFEDLIHHAETWRMTSGGEEMMSSSLLVFVRGEIDIEQIH